jgi:hypothetical protein
MIYRSNAWERPGCQARQEEKAQVATRGRGIEAPPSSGPGAMAGGSDATAVIRPVTWEDADAPRNVG